MHPGGCHWRLDRQEPRAAIPSSCLLEFTSPREATACVTVSLVHARISFEADKTFHTYYSPVTISLTIDLPILSTPFCPYAPLTAFHAYGMDDMYTGTAFGSSFSCPLQDIYSYSSPRKESSMVCYLFL